MAKILFNLLGNRTIASSRVRGFWMAEELETRGMQCRIVYGQNRRALLRCLLSLPGHDVIYFQKNYSRWHVYLMAIANYLGKKTLFDLDDAPSPTNNAITLRNAEGMMSQASAVLVGSQALLEYAEKHQPHSFLLPTSVKLEHYDPVEKSESDKALCLGWIGNGARYGKDLIDILAEPLKVIGSRQHIQFRLVGACGNRQLHEAFSDIPGVETTVVDQLAWNEPEAIRNELAQFDIGVYPLLENVFNRYKCGFKALEYMAMRIPVVASPVGALCDIIESGHDGYLAATPSEWVDALVSLASVRRRQEVGYAARKKIEASYNMTVTANTLSDIIES